MGALTASLHRTGAHLRHRRAYDPGRVFQDRLRRIHDLTRTHGHPLDGARALACSFEDALTTALQDARDAAAAASDCGAVGIVHGDNQPANVMHGRGGRALNDFERIIYGPWALDLAGLVLGIQHYGYPPSAGEQFLAGYGAGAPSLQEARPYARVRELSGIAVAMIHAGDSPQMGEQMHVRSAAITQPGHGEVPWTYLSPPRTSHLTFHRTSPDQPTDHQLTGSADGERPCEDVHR